jgi:hypothetical protein
MRLPTDIRVTVLDIAEGRTNTEAALTYSTVSHVSGAAAAYGLADGLLRMLAFGMFTDAGAVGTVTSYASNGWEA